VYNAGDLIVSMPCKDEKLDAAVRATLQDYAVIILAADGSKPGWGWESGPRNYSSAANRQPAARRTRSLILRFLQFRYHSRF
jgi:hypothetical protein